MFNLPKFGFELAKNGLDILNSIHPYRCDDISKEQRAFVGIFDGGADFVFGSDFGPVKADIVEEGYSAWTSIIENYQVTGGGPWRKISVTALVDLVRNLPGLTNIACAVEDRSLAFYRWIKKDNS